MTPRLTDAQVLAILRARYQRDMTGLKEAFALTWPQFKDVRDQVTDQARRVAALHGIPNVSAIAARFRA